MKFMSNLKRECELFLITYKPDYASARASK